MLPIFSIIPYFEEKGNTFLENIFNFLSKRKAFPFFKEKRKSNRLHFIGNPDSKQAERIFQRGH